MGTKKVEQSEATPNIEDNIETSDKGDEVQKEKNEVDQSEEEKLDKNLNLSASEIPSTNVNIVNHHMFSPEIITISGNSNQNLTRDDPELHTTEENTSYEGKKSLDLKSVVEKVETQSTSEKSERPVVTNVVVEEKPRKEFLLASSAKEK